MNYRTANYTVSRCNTGKVRYLTCFISGVTPEFCRSDNKYYSPLMAETGQDSTVDFIFSWLSSFISITSAFPSLPILKTFGHKETQVPQPIQVFLSMVKLFIISFLFFQLTDLDTTLKCLFCKVSFS